MPQQTATGSPISGAAITSFLTVFAVCVHGYHPYAEDGGLYIAGVKKVLDPALYPTWTQFVTEHLRFSLFAPFVAALVRTAHLPLPYVLLLLYCAGIWSTLYAGWMLASRCTRSAPARAGAVTLLACWLTLPIAGTSLLLMDPYITARSISTPLTLAALVWAMDASAAPDFSRRLRALLLCVPAICLAAVFHPLMAGYTFAAVAVLLAVSANDPRKRLWLSAVLLLIAITGAATLQAKAPAESPNDVWVAMTRYYWFPFRWQWYEQVGLIAPLILIAILARAQAVSGFEIFARLALTVAAIALAVAVAFSRARLATHLVARMQPLRCYQIVYELMILMLGAWLGPTVLKRKPLRWATLLLVFGALMFYVQRSTFPASAHLELPWRAPRNPWVRAFTWARDNTPRDALFALDAHYITRDGEDAQTFRAIAERSALPDYSKDGGEASITPQLTEAWVQGQHAQTNLDTSSDAARLFALTPFHVQWLVLQAASPTALPCPYANESVKICRIR